LQHSSIPEDANVPVPLIIMSTADPVLRDAAVFSALTDLPGTGVLSQDLEPQSGTIRRVIIDESGIAQQQTVPLAHSCLGCAIREDSLPALESMVQSGRWQRILWALPVTADTAPAARPLANPEIAGRVGVQLSGVASVVATDTLVDDLMGDELLSDRGIGLSPDDRRSVGEAIAAQLAHADLVLTTGSDARGGVLLDHLRGHRSTRSELFDAPELFLARHVHRVAESRIEPRLVAPPAAQDTGGVWTIDLQSHRPIHPRRFLDRITELGSGRVRSRGRFLLASRPRTVGSWDGAGGQLSIGDAGGWQGFSPSTRLIFTGIDNDRQRIQRAFRDVLLTDAEIGLGNRRWLDMDDGLDPWMGERHSASQGRPPRD